MLPPAFLSPPAEFSMMPFWFWNDTLDAAEILRQIDAFHAHGIHGFVLHPRVGLPRDCGWMSDKLLQFMSLAIDRASQLGMKVILYDEGMYPSGSSSGQVVAANPAHACRGFVKLDGTPASLPSGHTLIATVKRANGQTISVIDRPIESWIRGLHYTDHHAPRSPNGWKPRDTPEDHPPAADLLNPQAVASFIRLVYQKYFDHFGQRFGTTIPAIFTDEPMVLGRGDAFHARPGTTGILQHVNAYLGYDFTPHLPALWFDDEPDAHQHRAAYHRAINHRLEQTYYRQLYDWCTAHHIALTGHPEHPDDIGHLRYFHWPGQDIVWDYILPGEPAIASRQSTMAKCAASAAIHLGRRRNINEFMGAYGHDIPLSLYQFCAGWLLVRGCNLLIPHAYFYSLRGPRIDECPPELGLHSPWWKTTELQSFHDTARRLSWLNTDSTPHTHIAILGSSDHLPIAPARLLFEHQLDFHYLETRHLLEDCTITPAGLKIRDMTYTAILAEPAELTPAVRQALAPVAQAGRLLTFDPAVLPNLLTLARPTVLTDTPQPWLRARRVTKAGHDWILLFNEAPTPISCQLILPTEKTWHLVNPDSATTSSHPFPLTLASGALALFVA